MSNLIVRAGAIVACAVLLPVAFGSAARAQTPRPSPSAAATPVAFTAHAHGNATIVTQSGTFGGTVRLGVAHRDNLIRVDVIEVKSDQFPLPPISVSAVIDRGTNTITMWNDTTRQYRRQSFIPSFGRPSPQPGATARPGATPRPSASPRPAQSARRGTSPIANLDVLSLTVKLTGHGTTSGLPTTGMSLDFQVQGKGAATPAHVSATTQLADEFPFFPMTLDVTIEPGAPGLNAKVAYAVDDLTRELPPASRFTVPAGYTEARSFGDLIFQRRRTSSPMPMSSGMPMISPAPVAVGVAAVARTRGEHRRIAALAVAGAAAACARVRRPAVVDGSVETSRIYSIDPAAWTARDEGITPGARAGSPAGKPWGMTVVGDELRVCYGVNDDDDRVIRKFVPGHGFHGPAIPCPDATGSQLSYDGDRLFLSQFYNGRIMAIADDGSVGTVIELGRQIVGHVVVAGRFYVITADDEAMRCIISRASMRAVVRL